jgi:hypothetical protein
MPITDASSFLFIFISPLVMPYWLLKIGVQRSIAEVASGRKRQFYLGKGHAMNFPHEFG